MFLGGGWSAIPAPLWHSAAYHVPLSGGPSVTLLFSLNSRVLAFFVMVALCHFFGVLFARYTGSDLA